MTDILSDLEAKARAAVSSRATYVASANAPTLDPMHEMKCRQSQFDYNRFVSTFTPDAVTKLLKIARAAREVCRYDWSDNDDDAVHDIDSLRRELAALSGGEGK